MSHSKHTPAAIDNLPCEVWLEICSLSGESLLRLAAVNRLLRFTAYEFLYEKMGFETVDTFLSATRSWTASGGRVFNLVQQLKLGTTNADDISPVTQHDDNRRRTGEIAQTLDHALIRMGNLSNLEMKGVVLDSGFTSLLQNLKQLKECSLERVCVENAGECRPMALLAVENLKLVSICWHGRNRDSEIVRACLRLKKLTISWHADRADEMDWGENWTQSTCSTLAITTRLAWPARGEQLRRHRVKFISMLRMFPSVIELHIHGSIPPFFETDTEKKPMLVKMVNYRGPIHFLNLSRALPKVRSLNLTDCGLLGQHFREETLHVEAVRELTLDIFSCEEEIVCRLISVMSKLERLKVNISDDVFEQTAILTCIDGILSMNAGLQRVSVTASEVFVMIGSRDYFRSYRRHCPRLERIDIGDQSWLEANGLWREIL